VNIRTCTRCTAKHKARGLCAKHLSEVARRKAGAVKRGGRHECTLLESCHEPYYAKGGCRHHYLQQSRGRALTDFGPTETPAPIRPTTLALPANWDRVAPAKSGRGTDRTVMRHEIGTVPITEERELAQARHTIELTAWTLGLPASGPLAALGLVA